MELGETDLDAILKRQKGVENSRLDLGLIRYYWKEMLECVASVHEYGILHSDLKPANFLLVGGRLKLIDFGIVGTIQETPSMCTAKIKWARRIIWHPRLFSTPMYPMACQKADQSWLY